MNRRTTPAVSIAALWGELSVELDFLQGWPAREVFCASHTFLTEDFGDPDSFVAFHSNGVELVLIEKLDRLARDLMIQESIIADMERHGFEIRSVMEPDLCSKDPSRTLIRQMMGAFAQYERAMIVTKLRGARMRMRAKFGRCEGRKPYGTRPGEAEVIARMNQLRAQGCSAAKITEAINREARPRTGRQFYPANVARILQRVQG
jgi:resolvase-like protein